MSRVKTLLKRHGNDFFSRIGRLGFQATVDRHFGGNRQAAIRWLVQTGQWAIDQELSYHKPGIFGYPGPHPAHVSKMQEWLEQVEIAIDPNFPPFSE